jgi:hypothetical protein
VTCQSLRTSSHRREEPEILFQFGALTLGQRSVAKRGKGVRNRRSITLAGSTIYSKGQNKFACGKLPTGIHPASMDARLH